MLTSAKKPDPPGSRYVKAAAGRRLQKNGWEIQNMSTIEGHINDLRIKGYCCSQLVVSIAGLEPLDEENEGLLRSLRGLCIGMYDKKACGSLTGGACALALHLQGNSLVEACRELTEWFELRFKSIDCRDLIGDASAPTMICADIVKETCEKCLEMLMEMDCL
jgi:hypothetical protein